MVGNLLSVVGDYHEEQLNRLKVFNEDYIKTYSDRLGEVLALEQGFIANSSQQLWAFASANSMIAGNIAGSWGRVAEAWDSAQEKTAALASGFNITIQNTNTGSQSATQNTEIISLLQAISSDLQNIRQVDINAGTVIANDYDMEGLADQLGPILRNRGWI